MAELTLSAADIAAAIKKNLDGFDDDIEARTVGRVSEVGDGIARVSGLPDAAVNELLEFEDGTLGLALNLDTREIGVVVLGDFDKIEEGQTVRRTGEILSVPVGDGFMGRVIDPLGTPIDGLGEIASEERRALELQAPGVKTAGPIEGAAQLKIMPFDADAPLVEVAVKLSPAIGNGLPTRSFACHGQTRFSRRFCAAAACRRLRSCCTIILHLSV
jgi:F-type H+-transporting ATPase subunit alpha